jgi:hypothetical protein
MQSLNLYEPLHDKCVKYEEIYKSLRDELMHKIKLEIFDVIKENSYRVHTTIFGNLNDKELNKLQHDICDYFLYEQNLQCDAYVSNKKTFICCFFLKDIISMNLFIWSIAS